MTKYQYQIIDVEETAVLPIVLNAFGEIGWALHHSLPDGGYLLEREIEPNINIVGDVHVHGAEDNDAPDDHGVGPRHRKGWTEQELRDAFFTSEQFARCNPQALVDADQRLKHSAKQWAHWRANGLMQALRGEL